MFSVATVQISVGFEYLVDDLAVLFYGITVLAV